MDIESPPKCVNRELNSQISIRSQNSHFNESDGALPASMLLWGAAYYVRYVKRDANDSFMHNMFCCYSWVRHCRTKVWHYRTCCNSTDQNRHHTACDTYKDIHCSWMPSFSWGRLLVLIEGVKENHTAWGRSQWKNMWASSSIAPQMEQCSSMWVEYLAALPAVARARRISLQVKALIMGGSSLLLQAR